MFLNERIKNIFVFKKLKVYVGVISFKGGYGFESIMGKYFLFLVINVFNVVDSSNKEGWFMVEKEKILEWDFDFIFIDEVNFEFVK